jgi:hypothetical protein
MAKRVLLVGIGESLAIELQKARFRDDVKIVDVVSTRRAALAVMRRHGVDVGAHRRAVLSDRVPRQGAILAHRPDPLGIRTVGGHGVQRAAPSEGDA